MSEKNASVKPLEVLILAAGLGTRMKSRRAKVLHELGGLTLIGHVTRTSLALSPQSILVVVGHQAEQVENAVLAEADDRARFVVQARQNGTGDAVESARKVLENSDSLLLILSGDVPLIKAETLQHFLQLHRASTAACSILSVRLENPTGYGRIIRDEKGAFEKIVEHRDATPEQRQIREINAGIYCFDTNKLFSALRHIKPVNDQGEYYLTDVAEILKANNELVDIYLHHDAREVAPDDRNGRCGARGTGAQVSMRVTLRDGRAQ